MSYNANQLFNFIQGSDISGESAYDIWKRLGNTGTEADFLEYIRSGPKGDTGDTTAYYGITVSDTVLKKGENHVILPANVTFSGFYRLGTEATRYEYAGRFIIQETTDGDTWETKYTSEDDEVYVVYTPSNSDVKLIKGTLYVSGGVETELDTQNVAILADVVSLEVGARNLLSGSDVHYEITKDSSEMIDTLSIVDDFDLQRLIGKRLVLSYYVDTPGTFTSSGETNKFGMSAKLVWSDSTGTNADTVEVIPFDTNSTGINKERLKDMYYQVTAPEGYDTINDFTFYIQLSAKPDEENDAVWVFERPKLEIGDIATEWTIAPEDIQSAIARPDWNQNDETAVDYIKNRTHYTEITETEILPLEEREMPYQGAYYGTNYNIDNPLVEGKQYKVIWDGAEYIVTCVLYKDYYILGNPDYSYSIFTSPYPYGEHTEPFLIVYHDDAVYSTNLSVRTNTSSSVTFSLYALGEEVHQLDEKYIPDTIARVPSAADALGLLMGMGFIEPAGSDNEIYTDGNNTIYTL